MHAHADDAHAPSPSTFGSPRGLQGLHDVNGSARVAQTGQVVGTAIRQLELAAHAKDSLLLHRAPEALSPWVFQRLWRGLIPQALAFPAAWPSTTPLSGRGAHHRRSARRDVRRPDRSGEPAAATCTLPEPAKLNGVERRLGWPTSSPLFPTTRSGGSRTGCPGAGRHHPTSTMPPDRMRQRQPLRPSPVAHVAKPAFGL